MYGVQIAFKYYSPRLGIWGSTWTGMENLNRFFDSYYFWRLLRNTVGLSPVSYTHLDVYKRQG